VSSNYVALVTGAASGIGFKTARQFIETGATVVSVDIDEKRLIRAEELLGPGMVPMPTDIGDAEKIRILQIEVEQRFDKIDALINDAGKVSVNRLEDLDPDGIDIDLGVLLKGPMLLVKYFAPLLRRSSNPCIVNIASTAAILEIPRQTIYAVAKAGLIKFTRSCVHELPGIRSNCILPGLVDTAILNKYREKNVAKMKENYARTCPCGRVGKPEDIANAILFICSGKATYINGASIEMDGGSTRAANVNLF